MNILVEVNVFEDVLRQRQGWEASLIVLNSVRNGQAAGYVSTLTPPILYFFRRRTRSEKAARQAVQGILQNWVVAPLTGEAIARAYKTPICSWRRIWRWGLRCFILASSPLPESIWNKELFCITQSNITPMFSFMEQILG